MILLFFPLPLGSLRFAGDLPVAGVVCVALLAAAAVMAFYLRETRHLAAPHSYLLPALRGAAVALVIFILTGPIWHRRQIVGTLGKVVFAIDTSESMSVTDSVATASSPSRLDRAIRLLVGNEQYPGLVEALRRTHDVELVTFDESRVASVWSTMMDREPLESAISLNASGTRTNLASPLESSSRKINRDANRSDPSVVQSAIVIISDGRHNTGASPSDAAQRLASSQMQVMTLGMGSEDEPADAGIAQVIRPDSVAADGQLAGHILVKHVGLSGKPLDIRIEHLGEVVWSQQITPDVDGDQEVPFTLDVEPLVKAARGDVPRGVSRGAVPLDLRAIVDAAGVSPRLVVGPESSPQILSKNNAMAFRVAASTRDRRLLILDGSSRWEIRYIRNLFERDPAWKVDTLIFGPGTDTPTLNRGEGAGEFPSTIEAISAYDAIVLGELPTDQVRDADVDLIRQFVTRGGGLVIIDGRYGRVRELAQTKLQDLIPVNFELGPATRRATKVVPTGVGIESPVLNLVNSPFEASTLWDHLPAPQYATPVRAQAGAEVWASVILSDNSPSPWLVTRLFGAGRVVYLSSDQTWRWRYKVADQLHARFWNQLFAAVMQPPYSASDAFVALGTDKVEYGTGESSTIRVRLQDPAGKPMGDSTVDALLISGEQIVMTVPLVSDNPSRGTYQGQTGPLQAGEYEIRIRASGFDSTALQASAPIWVGTADTRELTRVSLDRNSLMQIAERGNGQYFHESSAEELLDRLKPLSSGSIVESDILVWQSFYWFWLIVSLLTMEWLLRKRVGLV
ncbi:VWA domain-containing protein [Novipirellula artificiosorum]|uniref:von Willebrand factor type A domain protein n=1 Tax=Novipirellula artificiosorum TaxID=2528016 RepID=A0A5C6DEM4_9BACT|nr:VWA domain-containing protein [Novipirellula artificiosorum]TWU33379.1 von Willebrand factor type A domain protein [Novipirellula artificiosorum]